MTDKQEEYDGYSEYFKNTNHIVIKDPRFKQAPELKEVCENDIIIMRLLSGLHDLSKKKPKIEYRNNVRMIIPPFLPK